MDSEPLPVNALLKPLRDLAKNWDIDIASELEDYLNELSIIRVSFGGGPALNFVEAAFIIQNSSVVYSKKVDFLYRLVNSVLDHILTSSRSHRRRRRGKASSTPVAGGPRSSSCFLLLDDELSATPDSEISLVSGSGSNGGAAAAAEPTLSSSFFLPESLSYRCYGYGDSVSDSDVSDVEDGDGDVRMSDDESDAVDDDGSGSVFVAGERLQFKCLKGYVDTVSGAVLLRVSDRMLLGQEDEEKEKETQSSLPFREQLRKHKEREKEKEKEGGRGRGEVDGGGDEIRLEDLKKQRRRGDDDEDMNERNGGATEEETEMWRKWVPLDPHSRIGIDHIGEKKFLETPFKKKTKFVIPRFPKWHTDELPVFGVSLHRQNVLSVLPFEEKVNLTRLYHPEFDYFASLEKQRIRWKNRTKRRNATTSAEFSAGLVSDELIDEGDAGDFHHDRTSLMAEEIGDFLGGGGGYSDDYDGGGGGDEIRLEDTLHFGVDGGVVDAEEDLQRFRRRESAFFDERFSLGSYQARFSIARMSLSSIGRSMNDSADADDDRAQALEFVNQTYEDLCRSHVARYMANTDAFLREAHIEERLAEWKKHLSKLGHRFDGRADDEQLDMLQLCEAVVALFDDIGVVLPFESAVAVCAPDVADKNLTELHRARHREASIARAFIVVLSLSSQGCLKLRQTRDHGDVEMRLVSREFKIDIPNILSDS